MTLFLIGLLQWILIFFCIIHLCLSLLLMIEVLAAVISKHREHESAVLEDKIQFSVLIPAHNESYTIKATLETLLTEVENSLDVVVVADNCTDNTASIAQALNVQVLERNNIEKIGKGYALDFGIRHLTQNPPKSLVILDADCYLKPGTLKTIVHDSIALNRPIQAIYRMALPEQPSPRDQISAFALIFKNQVRASGLSKLNCPILLGGTGMAFPWSLLQDIELASSHLVEDMKLAIDLAIARHNPKLAMDTLVMSQLPSNIAGATTQRTRWEQGHLQILFTEVPRILKAAWTSQRFDLLIFALDIAIPPLALWVMIGIGLVMGSGLLALLTGAVTPLMVQTISIALLTASLLIAWQNWSKEELPLLRLLSIPLYIIWKIPIYIKFIFFPEKSWVRTDRES